VALVCRRAIWTCFFPLLANCVYGTFNARIDRGDSFLEVGAMRSTPKLLAAITASGAILCLSVAADGHEASNQSELTFENERNPLSARVERLREKLRSSSPVLEEGSAQGQIGNIVQFFNFFNCSRPGWRNC
jgi:hypothetical protein